jgi:hypothetical protein
MVSGHTSCAAYLEQTVEDLLLHPGQLDPVSQQILLDEVTPVFTEKDIRMFLSPPSKQDVWETVCNSNLCASLTYKEC